MNMIEQFDAIWACASLLHVNRKEILSVIRNLIKATKVDGVIYMSFKYGDRERIKDKRSFNDYNEDLFLKLASNFKNVEIIKIWKTKDERPGKVDENWLNLILKKL